MGTIRFILAAVATTLVLSAQTAYAKVETTLVYLHVEEDRWHQEAQKHRLPKAPPSTSTGPTTD